MSVFIKGMEMPTGKDVLTVAITADGEVFSIGFDNTIEGGIFLSHPSTFPIQAVPVPSHGRLGDLDDLYAHLNEWYLTNNPVFTKEESIYIRAMLLGISEAPTIIQAEEGE